MSLNDIELGINESNQKTPKIDLSTDIETSILDSICIFFGIILVFGVFGCIITYIVYVIMSLCETSYSEQKDMCKESNVWLFLLLDLIAKLIVGNLSAKSKYNSIQESNTESKSNNTLESLISLSFAIWGCYELFGINCVDNLKSTLLYTMLQVTVINNIIIFGIIILTTISVCCIGYCVYIE